MDESQADNKGFCEIAGCTDVSVAQRWVVVTDGDQRYIEVCWKHEQGEIDPSLVAQ